MQDVHQPRRCLFLPDAGATDDFGRRMAGIVRVGDVILLDGPIGAGKTHFARALITARLPRPEDIPSPTFTLVQTYDADPEIWHADLYRLTHPDEAVELGLEDAFQTAICLIEWPERLGSLRPADALTLAFELVDAGAARRVTASGPPAWMDRLAAVVPADA
ncbi:MAG TPA: tRNA (adenosine(37)-N6)-threonylcarbamoyltransferase complex ATPase subunit type 1 TsaE [Paenirhodobacter sp.]